MTANPTAVVTGATAGIGAAFARRLAAEGYDLVLVARDGARLAEVAAGLSELGGGTFRPVVADLATTGGCQTVVALLTDPEHPVDLLVNNAGIGLPRGLLATTVEDEERLLDLNVRAVLRLTHAALGQMVERRSGAIVNVSSVAGFAALAPGSTYPASKAWVTIFTESVAQAVGRYGVRVMALCPGYTRTEFHRRAHLDPAAIPASLWLDADTLVRSALVDLRRGRTISVPDWKYKAAVFGLRHLPRSLLSRFAQRSASSFRRDVT